MFCTNCGFQMAESALFCTSCGRRRGVEPVAATQERPQFAVPTPQSDTVLAETQTTNVSEVRREDTRSFVKAALVGLTISAVFLALGVGLTATGATEFIIGERFTKSEMDDAVLSAVSDAKEAAEEDGYDAGYDDGKSSGYTDGLEDGRSSGYSSGYDDGCNHVFDEIGENLIAIRSPFYESNVYGFYWPRNEVC